MGNSEYTTAPAVQSALFSACRRYRYRLTRRWLIGEGILNFIMLNPSTADEVQNDPTVERCVRRAKMWGYQGLIVTNLFAWRATDPADMKAAADPIGPENNPEILRAASESSRVICAWGEDGAHLDRSDGVRPLLSSFDLYALKVNASGEPAHPLYLPYHLEPELLRAREGARA